MQFVTQIMHIPHLKPPNEHLVLHNAVPLAHLAASPSLSTDYHLVAVAFQSAQRVKLQSKNNILITSLLSLSISCLSSVAEANASRGFL